MNFIPSYPIFTSLVASLLLPLFLVILSHGFWKIVAPGRRFVLAAALAVAGWGTSLLVLHKTETADDVVAALLILVSAVLAEFTLWTLVAWGFTTSMLMSLAREDRLVTLEEWVSAYTDGRTIDTLAQDRLGVLFRLELAAQANRQVMIAPGAGQRIASLARALRTVFGLNPC